MNKIAAIGGYARQQTLKNSVSCSGVGLHSGATVAMTLHPAPVDTGIVFRRTDANGRGMELLAHVDNVVDARLCTTIGDAEGRTIATIEHLMSALCGCGIDNVVIDVDGPEVPVMDGSAAPFVFLVECAGVIRQDAPRRYIEVLKPVYLEGDDRRASLRPDNVFSLDFEIDFDSAAIGKQEMSVQLVNGTFKGEISRARTFGFAQEVDQLRKMGLARGGSLDNAVVVGDGIVLNEEGLRYGDEFVRHKILDSIGDLYLAGAPLRARFSGYRSGHALNHDLLRAMFADRTAWRYTTAPAIEDSRLPADEAAFEDVTAALATA
jgi:UDP-3-O-[3-hydroxymyristoyl] N-acetylglucosamine deacetylase